MVENEVRRRAYSSQINDKGQKMALAKFADTMIGSKDLPAIAAFYTNFLGMEVSNSNDGKSFMILRDPKNKSNTLHRWRPHNSECVTQYSI